MIKTLEKTGRTQDDAINAALKELGMDRDDVTVEIVKRAKSGFLGIGSTPAVVRVSYEVPDEVPAPKTEKKPEKPVVKEKSAPKEAKPAAKEVKDAPKAEAAKQTPAVPVKAAADENEEYAEIRTFLNGLFERMGVSADMEFSVSSDNGAINVNLSGPAMGAVIGRRGETLDAIQHLTNYVVNHGSDNKRHHINIDAEDYRAKREESLSKLAVKMAEKAIKYKRNMALEPMNSYERHVIHTALQDYEGVTTASTGEDPNRRVVVNYIRTESDKKAGTGRAAADRPSYKAKAREDAGDKGYAKVKTEETATAAVTAAAAVESSKPAESTNTGSNKPKAREWA